MSLTLKNLNIVVTRPAHQAGSLCEAIEGAGGHAIRWPVLAIEAIELSDQTKGYLSDLRAYDRVIFISANAAKYGLTNVAEADRNLPGFRVYAVGKATAAALKHAGVNQVQVPRIASSEGLLAMPEFSDTAITGQRCLIFRGVGGNEELAESLRLRGAKCVDYAEVYRRVRADSDPAILETLWQQQALDMIMVTSCDGLDNLFAILGRKNATRLCATPLLTVSKRVADYATRLGFNNQLLIADSASNEDIITTMQVWHQKGNQS